MHQDRTTRRSAIGIAAALIFGIGITAGTGIGSAPAYAETDEEIAVSLASLLRASRAVISKNQKHINDANVGDKGLSSSAVVATAKENFKKATGEDIDSIDAGSVRGQLLKAELDAMAVVMDEAQANINEKGKGLKGFLPAVFARLVAEKFSASVDGKASLKLTAPKDYIRNRRNRPDKWESDIIESKFRSASHPKNQHVAELSDIKGKAVFRVILPEYYGESCLGCHGDPKGERDITGGKKEGGKLGELGGAISVAIFK